MELGSCLMFLADFSAHVEPSVTHHERLIEASLRQIIKPETLVSACYMRLAMGFSHAVHILMQINFRLISMALSSSRFLVAAGNGIQGPSSITSDHLANVCDDVTS